ncbi:Phosphomevalonate kinase [Caenorhabditis elegans]|nr:Phosphomevalonate kinase [Caenorhabditis elegans]CAD66220.1 Phosphomevalonate kinase [Caenorhabditis elegans]|eukprot:NP_001256277.1 Uncharacterized protein CELE_F32D8.13 [Caenorhabditis elegans]
MPIVIAISGKRKSGKDYCTNLIREVLVQKRFDVSVAGISHSLKMEFAKKHGLKYEELLTDGPYKELYRKDMIQWGEEARCKDSGLFCRAAISSTMDSDIVIISDCRRRTDYEYFSANYRTVTIRIETSEEDRKQRGYQFVEGVDDAESECGLDDYKFNLVIKNQSGTDLSQQLNMVTEKISRIIDKL